MRIALISCFVYSFVAIVAVMCLTGCTTATPQLDVTFKPVEGSSGNETATSVAEVLEKRLRVAGIQSGRAEVVSATSVRLHFESVEDEHFQQLLANLATRTRLRFHQIHANNDAIRMRAANGNFPMPAGYLPTEMVTINDTGKSTETLIMSVLDVGVTNRHIEEARAEMGSFGTPLISINFTATGTQRFGELTTNMIGQRLAIVVDDVILAAPSINEPITGGQAQISGSYTVQEAADLANELDCGWLPVDVTVQAIE